MIIRVAAGLAALLAAAAADMGQAQTAPPAGAAPSVERVAPAPDFDPADSPFIVDDEPRPPNEGSQPAGPRFIVERVAINGATVLDAAAAAPLVRDLIGTAVTTADMRALAAALTALYRRDGWVASEVILPPQTVENGVVVFEAVEGFIEAVEIIGDDRAIVRRRASRAVTAGPLSAADLEDAILRINDLPGTRAEARLIRVPGDAPAARRLIVEVDHDPIAAASFIDNYGTQFTGPFRGTVGVSANGLIGGGESAAFALRHTLDDREYREVELRLATPVHPSGLDLALRLGGARTDTTLDLAAGVETGVTVETAYADLQASLPLRRRSALSITAFAGVEASVEESRLDLFGSDIFLSEDRIVAAELGIAARFRDPLGGRGGALLTVRQGLGLGFGGDRDPSSTRSAAPDDFTTIVLDVARVQPLFAAGNVDLALSARIRGQWSDDPLVLGEQAVFGGRDFGRGYDEGDILGDRAIAGSLELGATWRASGRGVALQPYLFADGGLAWALESDRGGAFDRESLGSAGGGVRLRAPFGFEAEIELSKPLGASITPLDNAEGDPRIRFRTGFRL